MENKVLVTVFIPMFNDTFDIFIPVNEYIWRINNLILKSINSINNNVISEEKKFVLINIETGMIYDSNNVVINTDIRNNSKLTIIEAN